MKLKLKLYITVQREYINQIYKTVMNESEYTILIIFITKMSFGIDILDYYLGMDDIDNLRSGINDIDNQIFSL